VPGGGCGAGAWPLSGGPNGGNFGFRIWDFGCADPRCLPNPKSEIANPKFLPLPPRPPASPSDPVPVPRPRPRRIDPPTLPAIIPPPRGRYVCAGGCLSGFGQVIPAFGTVRFPRRCRAVSGLSGPDSYVSRGPLAAVHSCCTRCAAAAGPAPVPGSFPGTTVVLAAAARGSVGGSSGIGRTFAARPGGKAGPVEALWEPRPGPSTNGYPESQCWRQANG